MTTSSLPPKADIYDWLEDEGNSRDDLLQRMKDTPLWDSHTSQVTQPLDTVLALPPPPIHSLPPTFAQYVTEGAASLGVPPEMIALPLMQFLGALVGNRVQIQMKRNFVQYGALWVALIADPGSLKSPALNLARWPLDILQREATDLYNELLAQWDEDVQRWNRADAEGRGPKPVRPKHRDFFTTNATIEAIVGALQATPGLTLFKDELVSFITSMDQYRGGKGSDRQEYLSGWSFAPLKVNRRTGEPVFLPHPVLGMSGGIVTDRVADLHDRHGNRDGLFERFILIRCHVVPQPWTDDDLDPALLDPVLETFRKLDRIPFREMAGGVVTVKLDRDARDVWRDWYNENAQLRTDATGMARGYYAKLELMVSRIALILSMLWNPDNPGVLITAERMADACEWGEFIRQHFHSVMPLVNETGGTRVGGLQSRIRRLLRNDELHEHDGYVSRRTILQRLGNVKADDLTSALEAMEREDLVERLIEETATKPRESWRIKQPPSVVDFPSPSRLAPTGTEDDWRPF
jgi:hypothetical protein